LALQQGDITDAEKRLEQLKEDHPAHVKVRLAEAELLTAQQNNDQAISVLKDTVSQLPYEPEPIRYLAILLARQGRQEECQTVIKDALARINEPAAHRRLSLLLADFYERWDQHEKAYEFLNSLVNSRPGQVPIIRRLLRCRQVAENLEKAQQLVDNIKSLEGEDGWQWRYEQARIWFAQDNFEENYPKIVSLLEKNLLANPNDQPSRLLLAAAYERSGELQLALSTYRDALNRAPDDLRVIIPAVTAFYKAREHEQAQEILNRASEKKLYHPELRKLQLQNYLSSGQWDSATKILETLLDKDEQNAPVCLSLALLKMRRGSFGQAEELLTKLKDQKPDWLPATVAQIELYVRQNKSTEALTLCDHMVKSSGNAAAYILRGKTYAMLGQREKAEEDLEQATLIESDSLPAWIAKSDFHRLAGDFDLAVECAQKAIFFAPDNPNVQRRAVSLLLASKKPDLLRQANTILDEALQSNPTDIDLLLLRAHCLVAEGTAPAIEEAQRILQDVTEQYPKTDRAWAALGEIALAGPDGIGKALDIALKGLAYLPDNKALLLLKARCEAKRSVTLAVPTLEALYEMDPSDTDVAVLLAETYVAAGQSEKAVKMLRAQLRLCRPSARRKYTIALAGALYNNGDPKEAGELFEALCRDAPDDAAPMLAQVRLLKHDNLWDQMADRVTSWCRNHVKDSRTIVTVAAELAATQSTEARKAAEDVLRMLIANDSDCTRAISALAMLLQMGKRPVEAAQLYQRVLELEGPERAAETARLY
ncbi:MAG: tetratricopeptide repeat protein, partial [Planctomycetota bacterium]